MGLYSDEFLRRVRNQIRIDEIIYALRLETRNVQELLRFRCPKCHGFHTATNPKTNLGRCFDCERNYNPIDLVMAVTHRDFVETVEFLKTLINSSSQRINNVPGN